MTSAVHPHDTASRRPMARRVVPPQVARGLLTLVIAISVLAGVLAAPAASAHLAVAQAGDDLVRLMRFMAGLKGLMAAGTASAVLWRLGVPVTRGWLGAYCVACGAMVAGPGLIWSMVYVGTGAILLHGGLALSIVLLWRDPKVAQRLDMLLLARRGRRVRLEVVEDR